MLTPLSGLVTKNPLEHHSDGLPIGTASITLLFIASANILSAASFMCNGG